MLERQKVKVPNQILELDKDQLILLMGKYMERIEELAHRLSECNKVIEEDAKKIARLKQKLAEYETVTRLYR
jgi:hypothetical protein